MVTWANFDDAVRGLRELGVVGTVILEVRAKTWAILRADMYAGPGAYYNPGPEQILRSSSPEYGIKLASPPTPEERIAELEARVAELEGR